MYLKFDHLTEDQQSHILCATSTDTEFEVWEIIHGQYEIDDAGHVWLVEPREQ